MAGFWSGFAEGLTEVKEREQERLLQQERIEEQRRAQQAGFDFAREQSSLEHTRSMQRSAFSTALAKRNARAESAEAEAEAIREARSFLSDEAIAVYQSTGNLSGILKKFTVDKRTPEAVNLLNSQATNIIEQLGDRGVQVFEVFATEGYDAGQQALSLALQDPNYEPMPLSTATSVDAEDYGGRMGVVNEILGSKLGIATITTDKGVQLVLPDRMNISDIGQATIWAERRIAELQPTRGIGEAKEIVAAEIGPKLEEFGLLPESVLDSGVKTPSTAEEAQEFLMSDPNKPFGQNLLDDIYNGR